MFTYFNICPLCAFAFMHLFRRAVSSASCGVRYCWPNIHTATDWVWETCSHYEVDRWLVSGLCVARFVTTRPLKPKTIQQSAVCALCHEWHNSLLVAQFTAVVALRIADLNIKNGTPVVITHSSFGLFALTLCQALDKHSSTNSHKLRQTKRCSCLLHWSLLSKPIDP